MTETARGADERKSLKKLKHRLNNDYYFLLENLFDMVNRRNSVFSCWCYIVRSISLDVLCVAKIVCVCVCGILVRTSVFVCVCFLVVSELLLLITI